VQLKRWIAALCAAGAAQDRDAGQGLRDRALRALRISPSASLPLCSGPAPLAEALPCVATAERRRQGPPSFLASANPHCVGVSSGLRRPFGRSATTGERGEPLSQTLTPAALWRGLAAGWAGGFAEVF